MSFSWWWLGAGAGVVAVLSGLHWTVLDLLLDQFGTRRSGRWPDRRAQSSDPAGMLES